MHIKKKKRSGKDGEDRTGCEKVRGGESVRKDRHSDLLLCVKIYCNHLGLK